MCRLLIKNCSVVYDSVILVVKTLNTLLIYDNKSLASHNECDFVQHFLLNQPIHERKPNAWPKRRHCCLSPCRLTSVFPIYFRFLLFYWYLLPFPHLLLVFTSVSSSFICIGLSFSCVGLSFSCIGLPFSCIGLCFSCIGLSFSCIGL
jgi:hypothetical protein